MKKLNIIFSIILIAVSACFYFYADTFKTLPGQQEIGPGAFPKAVCIGLVICSMLLIISEVRKGNPEKAGLFNLPLLVGIGAVILYFFLLRPLGFVIDSMLITFVMMVLLNEPIQKAWPLLASVSILTPVVLYAIFGILLKVPLPAGILSFLG